MGAARGLDFWSRFVDGERIGLDTGVFLYYLNRQQPYFSLCVELLHRIESGRLRGVISVVSEMEILANPNIQSRPQIFNDVEQFIGRLAHLEIIPVDRTIARRAADLRARTRLKGLDALIGATSLTRGCRQIVGNDREFEKRITGMTYLMLDDYLTEE